MNSQPLNSQPLKISLLLNILFFSLLLVIGIRRLRPAPAPEPKSAPPRDMRVNFDPEQHALQSREQAELPGTHHDIVFVGDSLTARGHWDEWFPGYDTLNRGIGGDMTLGIAERLPEVYRHTPSIVVLEGGTNDLSRGDTPETVVASLKRLIADIHRHLPHARIILQSVYPMNPSMATANNMDQRPDINAVIQEVNAKMRHEPGIEWVDIHSRIGDSLQILDRRYSVDGIHLNAAGYKIVTDTLRPYLHTVASRRPHISPIQFK